MGKLWVVARREYLERVRSKWFIVSTILTPVLLGTLVFLPAWMAHRSQPSTDVARIIVVDASGTRLGSRVATELNGGLFGDASLTQVMEVAPADAAAAQDSARQEVLSERAKGYLVIDTATVAGDTARYVGTNASSPVDMRRIERVLGEQLIALRLERAGVDPAQVRSITTSSVTLHAERPGERSTGGSAEVTSAFAFSVAFLLYFSIFLYGQNVMRGVIEEKQSRVAEVVVASVSATRLLGGKVLGVGAVGITQIALSIGASMLLYKLRAPLLAQFGLPAMPIPFPEVTAGDFVLLLTYFVLGYLFYAALFAAVGAVVSTEQEAQQVQLPVAMLLVVSAIFIQPVLLAPDSSLAATLSLVPFSAPIMMPLRLALVPVPWWTVASSIAALALGCYAAVWIAARIYRTGLLMYGKRPTLRELVRWIRVAR